MTIRKIKKLVLLTLLLAAPGVWAETIDCTPITTLPTIITVQGIYCFTGDLATSMPIGTAIDIQTNNVTIDLNGWKLGGLAAGPDAWAHGIYAYQRKNITIRNGTIRGFHRGIWLRGVSPYTISQGHLIEDIRADKNTFAGIDVRGRGSIVRRNQVVDTGGSTRNNDALSIQLYGPGVRALNNDISGTTATASGDAFGLYLRDANGAVAEGNRIDDVSSGSGGTFGVYIWVSSNVLIRSNSITSSDKGIFYAASTGKYMDTLTSSVTTSFTGGTSVGTNS